MAVDIPDKLYYKIGEVAALLRVKTHVLRYWETEFKALQPVKSRSNQRLYRRKDVETALLIKDLLYRQGFTIAGARKKLMSDMSMDELSEQSAASPAEVLQHLKTDLQRIRQRLLDNPDVE
ncbi:transcriptional regulator, MerR family [Malonomonas rubra DSM 5091]|uniref:Transcriptional regulator, MerR family n=1 Tax=Malonomonas rubra DSM 5091 TaxID=1122189 RepID=A0A1M6DC05_MALRU|nr:MerR family transcriptional regulator [Malonomonas rubra]SHI70776.1 transcriptional regulator, MerR family [Malonomonas rubra DSM 5091]